MTGDVPFLSQLMRRPRRLRRTPALRELVAEVTLHPRQLVLPIFVVPGRGQIQPVTSLPDVNRLSVDQLLPRLERALELGIRAVLLFGVVNSDVKSGDGVAAYHPEGPVPTALREARRHFGTNLVLITDVCLCAYTDHGHCGLLTETPTGMRIDNDSSLEPLTRIALVHAEAGADLVAPSDMMDGRVAAIRHALDDGGFGEVGIFSYAVKYASAFYGPFRDAVGSSPSSDPGRSFPKDRKSYQMDPRNSREGLIEAALDEVEGAEVLMVKPALPYLDMLTRLRVRTELTLAAYQVSGEYAMLKSAAAAGALDEAAVVRESLLSISRAGADLIVSYYAAEVLEKGWLT
jgi:porphobilinogen synthase